jgi:hypothetical protein
LLAVAGARAGAGDPEPGPAAAPWEDPAQLAVWLDEACAAVEVATGRTFDPRPTVRLADADALRAVLIEEFSGFDPRALGKAEGRRMAALLAPGLMAKYAPDEHAILFQPAAFRLVAGLQPSREALGADHVRVLLAHEATHALDFQHHPLHARMKASTNSGQLRAVGAMAEGHAQFVAEQVARTLDLLPAFERFTYAITGEPEEVAPGMRPMLALMLGEVRFAYVIGHRFFEAVHAARGREGVEAALADPPLDPSWVETPRYWLDPSTRPASRDLASILATCHALAPAPPWVQQDTVMLRSQLASQAARLPDEQRLLFLEGFEAGHAFVGQFPAREATLVLAIVAFDTEAMATRFATDNRTILEGASEALASLGIDWSETGRDEALGAKRDVPGIYVERTLHVPGGTKRVTTLQFRRGDLAFDMMAVDAPWLDRAVFDQVVDRLVAACTDPAAARALPLDVGAPPHEAAPGAGGPDAEADGAEEPAEAPEPEPSAEPAGTPR